MAHTMKLTADHIREALFSGMFAPMSNSDFMAYADANPGSLIADICFDSSVYQVIFDPIQGDAEVVFNEENGEFSAWNVNLKNDQVIQLV